jgi:cytochrome c-type biogenesis protein CcmE
MNRKQKKLIGLITVIIILAAAIGLVLYALKQNINLFYTPTQLLKNPIHTSEILRIGGYVKAHSVYFDPSGKNVTFVITDKLNEIKINYQGILPNLFREGQGVVVTGKLVDSHTLLASEVLAKHDEKYMPFQSRKS